MGLMAVVLTYIEREPFHPWDATHCSRELYWLGELVLSLAGDPWARGRDREEDR